MLAYTERSLINNHMISDRLGTMLNELKISTYGNNSHDLPGFDLQNAILTIFFLTEIALVHQAGLHVFIALQAMHFYDSVKGCCLHYPGICIMYETINSTDTEERKEPNRNTHK